MNTNLLKAEIVRNGLKQADVVKYIGISNATFTRKLKRGAFGTDEAEKMISLLHIKNPSEIFFGENVT